MKRILLLGAGFGTGNLGVSALATGALKVILTRLPGTTVDLLDYGREPVTSTVRIDGHARPVTLVNLRFSWKLLLPNNAATLLVLALSSRPCGSALRRWLEARNPWLRSMAEADLAAAVSGGDSFSDIYGRGRFFYVALPQLLALAMGLPLVLLPQTLGPFRHGSTRLVARFILRRATLVHSRDAAGLEEVRHLLGPDAPPARFCPDLAFVLEAQEPPRVDLLPPRACGDEGRPRVGVNVSGLLLMGGYTRGNEFALKLDYGEFVDRLITHMVEVKGADVMLVPHVFSDDAESDTQAARTVLERLRPKLGAHLQAVVGVYGPGEIKYIVGMCEFFVGSRMHACIAALSQGIPAVGVAYSDKFIGVFDSIGAGGVVADPRHLDIDAAIDVISKAFDARAAAGADLRAALPAVRRRVLALLDPLADPLSGPAADSVAGPLPSGAVRAAALARASGGGPLSRKAK